MFDISNLDTINKLRFLVFDNLVSSLLKCQSNRYQFILFAMRTQLHKLKLQILFVLINSLCLLSSNAFSQNKNQLFQKAQNALDIGHFNTALELFKQLDSIEPNNAFYNFFLGICFINTKSDYTKAIETLEFTIKYINNKETNILPQAYLNLGKAYALNNRFDDAISVFEKITTDKLFEKVLVDEANHEIEVCNNAKMFILNPTKVTVENLGSGVNSKYSDYAPLIMADESMLMFTSKRPESTGGAIGEDGQYLEDIYFIQKDEKNKWSPPKNIGFPINTNDNDATVALSVDGEKLFLYRGEKGEILVSDNNGINWNTPKKLGKNINSGNSETSASLSSDGKTLYFVSSRPGGYGGKDIYKSEMMENGEWGAAVNLGATINTSYDEESPFIHPDNKTLYFSSQGHNSMGGFDIFKARLEDSHWTDPENMGFPINTPADEIHFVLSARGGKGYYASNRSGGFGAEDLYMVTFQKPNIPLTMIRGSIITDGKKKLNVKIKIIDKETNNEVKYVYNPNPETGKYLMIFPPGKNYQMLVDAEGYSSFVFNLYIPNQTYFYELYQTMYLKSIAPFDKPIGQGVSIENSFYNLRDSVKDNVENKGHDSLLLSLIDKIIETTDSVKLKKLENLYTDKKDYTPLTTLVDQIIETTDSVALKNIKKITSQGFIEKADQNIFFYGDKKTSGLEPLIIGNDTIYLIPPSLSSESDNLIVNENISVKEKVDEVTFKTVLSRSIPFDFNIAAIPKQFKDTIYKIAALLNKYPNLKVEIIGYTDNRGSGEYNQRLSEQRAGEVAEFLNENGVQKMQILFYGKGQSEPLQTNETLLGRKANRRVEIRINEIVIKQRVVH